GYSAFGANNKYAFFPSVATAWNIASESFYGKYPKLVGPIEAPRILWF
ncbi:hypothetical protein OBE_07769, partial [human gut metagenome]